MSEVTAVTHGASHLLRVDFLFADAPTAQGTSAPQFSTPLWNPTNAGFASSLEYLFTLYGTAGTLSGEAGATAAPSPAASGSVARLARNSNVRVWIFGHTHFNCDNTILGTVRIVGAGQSVGRHNDIHALNALQRVVSNQKGYELWGHAPEGGPAYRSDAVIAV